MRRKGEEVERSRTWSVLIYHFLRRPRPCRREVRNGLAQTRDEGADRRVNGLWAQMSPLASVKPYHQNKSPNPNLASPVSTEWPWRAAALYSLRRSPRRASRTSPTRSRTSWRGASLRLRGMHCPRSPCQHISWGARSTRRRTVLRPFRKTSRVSGSPFRPRLHFQRSRPRGETPLACDQQRGQTTCPSRNRYTTGTRQDRAADINSKPFRTLVHLVRCALSAPLYSHRALRDRAHPQRACQPVRTLSHYQITPLLHLPLAQQSATSRRQYSKSSKHRQHHPTPYLSRRGGRTNTCQNPGPSAPEAEQSSSGPGTKAIIVAICVSLGIPISIATVVCIWWTRRHRRRAKYEESRRRRYETIID
ncbi:hypothetical protein VUR80DRAFT_2914 [Thermomyces stellatus]